MKKNRFFAKYALLKLLLNIMKTNNKKLDFTKSSLVELSDKQIIDVKGGSLNLSCILRMSSILIQH